MEQWRKHLNEVEEYEGWEDFRDAFISSEYSFVDAKRTSKRKKQPLEAHYFYDYADDLGGEALSFIKFVVLEAQAKKEPEKFYGKFAELFPINRETLRNDYFPKIKEFIREFGALLADLEPDQQQKLMNLFISPASGSSLQAMELARMLAG